MENNAKSIKVKRSSGIPVCKKKITFISENGHHYSIYFDPRIRRFRFDNLGSSFEGIKEPNVIVGLLKKIHFNGVNESARKINPLGHSITFTVQAKSASKNEKLFYIITTSKIIDLIKSF